MGLVQALPENLQAAAAAASASAAGAAAARASAPATSVAAAAAGAPRGGKKEPPSFTMAVSTGRGAMTQELTRGLSQLAGSCGTRI